MPSSSSTPPSNDTVTFPLHLSPIGIFFTIVPALVIATAAYCFMIYKLPIVLMLLMIAVSGCCAALIKAAIEEMGPVTVEWSTQGVTVRGVLGAMSYYWSHIERVETYDPGATFGDRGRHEEQRVAIGLFIRKPAKKNVVGDDVPDIMIISRAGEAGEKIPKLAERLSNARRYGGKDTRKIGGQPANSRQARQFRRTASATAA